jgi:hypothetical protein
MLCGHGALSFGAVQLKYGATSFGALLCEHGAIAFGAMIVFLGFRKYKNVLTF